MPDRQASIAASKSPLPSRRSRIRSESDRLSKQSLPLTPKSKSESKLKNSRKINSLGTLSSKGRRNRHESPISRSSVTKTLVFTSDNIETIPISQLNNSEPLERVSKAFQCTPLADLKDEITVVACIKREPILATVDIDVRHPVDNILAEEDLCPVPNLHFRLHDSYNLNSNSIMVSPSKANIVKPSMCQDQNSDSVKSSHLRPKKLNRKSSQTSAQVNKRLTRASSSTLSEPSLQCLDGRLHLPVSPAPSLNANSEPSLVPDTMETREHQTTIAGDPNTLSTLSTCPISSLISLLPPIQSSVNENIATYSSKSSLFHDEEKLGEESESEEEITPPASPITLSCFHDFVDLSDSEDKSIDSQRKPNASVVLSNLKKSRDDKTVILKKFDSDTNVEISSHPLPNTQCFNLKLENPADSDVKLESTKKNAECENSRISPEQIMTEVVTASKKMGIKKCSLKYNIPINTIKEWMKARSRVNSLEANICKAESKIEKEDSTEASVVNLLEERENTGKPCEKNGFGKNDNITESLANNCENHNQENPSIDVDEEIIEILEICTSDSDIDIQDTDTVKDQPQSNEQIGIHHDLDFNEEKRGGIFSKEIFYGNIKKNVSSKELTLNKGNIKEKVKKFKGSKIQPIPRKMKGRSHKKSIKNRIDKMLSKVLESECDTDVTSKCNTWQNIEPLKNDQQGKCQKKVKEIWQSTETKLSSKKLSIDNHVRMKNSQKKVSLKKKLTITSSQNKETILTKETAIFYENEKDTPDQSILRTKKEHKIKLPRGRPKKTRSTSESMDASIEAVVQNSVLKYEESLLESKKESCKEIELCDLPLSQVRKLRKEIKRSLFIQKKKEQYKEIFRKKKLNGTLKLNPKHTRTLVEESLEKWKSFKLKRSKDHKNMSNKDIVPAKNVASPNLNEQRKIKHNSEKPPLQDSLNNLNFDKKKKKINPFSSKRLKNSDELGKKKDIQMLENKPKLISLEEHLSSKSSFTPKETNTSNQSYTFFDSDVARPSRHIVRPVRYLDFSQDSENLAIIRLDQAGDKSMLPYEMDKLDWNEDHSANMQGVYCYCGGSGSWHTKMVRCARCDQWFHERCLAPRPFNMPIICGDSFWLFVCSMCNMGSECLKRMDIGWIDLVHLAIFDLTTKTKRKFHDFENDLMPYMLKNWSIFQLYKHFNILTDEEKKLKTKETLLNSDTFEQGSETEQQEGIWGLRNLLPPPRPVFSVPNVGIISERTVLNEVLLNLTIIPQPDNFVDGHFNVIYKDYIDPVLTVKAKKIPKVKKIKYKKSTQTNGCSSHVISHRNIQRSLKNKSCKVKFKCLKLPKEFLTENLKLQNCENGVEEKKPLPYEISKSLHQRGYPKVAMKFATIIPPKKAIVVKALEAEHKPKKKRGPKTKKIVDNPISAIEAEKDPESSSDISESSLLDALIPVKLDYCGDNNPFQLGSIEEQRAARNLICNRKLKEEDLTKCRSRIKKRKHHLFIEESRKLWKSNVSEIEKISTRSQKKEEAKKDMQYVGRQTTPSGEIKFIMLNPEIVEVESQTQDILETENCT